MQRKEHIVFYSAPCTTSYCPVNLLLWWTVNTLTLHHHAKSGNLGDGNERAMAYVAM